MQIYSLTIDRLKQSKGDYSRIARIMGVDKSWPGKLVNGSITDPGFFKVAKLIKALDQVELMKRMEPSTISNVQHIN